MTAARSLDQQPRGERSALARTGVVFLVDGYSNPHAGTERQLHRLTEELVAGGTRCHVLLLAPPARVDPAPFPCSWSCVGRSTLSAPGTWLATGRALARLRRAGFGIVHTFFNDASVLGPPLGRLLGLPVVVSRRDMGFWITGGYRRALRITGRCVDRCVANSEAVAAAAREVEGIPDARLLVVPNGVPDDAPREAPAEVHEEIARPDPTTVVLGIVANVRPVKRVHDLVTALASLRRRKLDVLLVVVGGGDLARLEAHARALGVTDRVRLVGSRPDARAWLPAFDIGVLCSESEGLSNTLIEYQLAGLATVCTNSGGNPEVVLDGETGLLYPPGDLAALEKHLAALVTAPGLRARIGARAAASARGRFDPAAMAERYRSLYAELVPRGTP
jgi:glycosyltransferase involved in cell wall biosynthesis